MISDKVDTRLWFDGVPAAELGGMTHHAIIEALQRGYGRHRVYGPTPKDMLASAQKAARGAASNIGFGAVTASQYITLDLDKMSDGTYRASVPNKHSLDTYLEWYPDRRLSE